MIEMSGRGGDEAEVESATRVRANCDSVAVTDFSAELLPVRGNRSVSTRMVDEVGSRIDTRLGERQTSECGRAREKDNCRRGWTPVTQGNGDRCGDIEGYKPLHQGTLAM